MTTAQVECCLANSACWGGGPPGCIPALTTIVSTQCRDVLLNYCAGTMPADVKADTSWLQRWQPDTPNNCSEVLIRNLYELGGPDHCFRAETYAPPKRSNCGPTLPDAYSSEGFFWTQRVINAALRHYSENGFVIGAQPGTLGYNSFQDILFAGVCCANPGMCDLGLQQQCLLYNGTSLSRNPTASAWCGCRLPAAEYQSYQNRYGITPVCTPYCNRNGVIPRTDGAGQAVTCQTGVCLIDDVSITLQSSQVTGDITFEQLCNNCANPGAPCNCLAEKVEVDIANSTIGGNVFPVQQRCSSFSCNQPNVSSLGPDSVPVPCAQLGATGSNPFKDYDQSLRESTQSSRRWGIVIVLLLVMVCLGVVIILLASVK